MNKKTKKRILYVFLIGIVIAVSTVYYLFNMPQRDVQSTETDFTLSADQIVEAYLTDATLANNTYLQEDGDSKVMAITGEIFSINTDLNNQKVIRLKSSTSKAGVSCTFTESTNASVDGLKIGDIITVKGVIRSGAGYDEDLEMYEDVIIEKCDLINNKNK
jgi:hypothetical protein